MNQIQFQLFSSSIKSIPKADPFKNNSHHHQILSKNSEFTTLSIQEGAKI